MLQIVVCVCVCVNSMEGIACMRYMSCTGLLCDLNTKVWYFLIYTI